MSSSTNIIPKPCSYNCSTRIYWNNEENTCFEVFSKKKHVCPNRSNKTTTTNNNISSNGNNRQFYSKKVGSVQCSKMSISLELLTGPIDSIQKKYEILSDIVTEYNDKVHGSQSNVMQDNSISLIVYYEVPEGKREVKQRFNTIIRNNNQLVLQK
jgi:hypothetical protein